jgi:hypothetical protein
VDGRKLLKSKDPEAEGGGTEGIEEVVVIDVLFC